LIFHNERDGLVRGVFLDYVVHEPFRLCKVDIPHGMLNVLVDDAHANNCVVIVDHGCEKPFEGLERVRVVIDANHKRLGAPLMPEAIVFLIESDACRALVQVRMSCRLECDVRTKPVGWVSTWKRNHGLDENGQS
jgi:hypothetical protein